MRIKLKLFRIARNFSQSQMAEKLGCSRAYYGHIERGFMRGSATFWERLRTAFELSDDEIKELQGSD